MAQAVQEVAQGGMVLLSESTFAACNVEALRLAGISVAHMGMVRAQRCSPLWHSCSILFF